MKMKHWLGGASLVLLSSALGVGVWSRVNHVTKGPGARALQSGAAAYGPCVFEVDDELAYDVRVEVERVLSAGPLAASGQQQPVESSVAAELHMRVLGSEPSGAVLLARFANVETQAASGLSDAPFLLRIEPSCQLAGFARHTQTAAQAGRIQQGLAHELNFVAAAPQATATLEADDSVGHYRATFAARSSASGALIERRVTAYTRLWEAREAAEVKPSVSRAEIVVGSGPWLQQLSSRQLLRGAGSADLDTRVEVSSIESASSVLEGADTDASQYVWENLLPRITFPRADRPVTQRDLAARAALRDQPLEQALAAHVVRSREVENFAEVWPPLTTYLEARPEQTGTVVKALRSGAVPPEGRAAGWVAIGQARTQEARTELLAVLRDGQAAAINRTRAMFALVDRADVGAELTAELASYAMDISTAPSDDGRFFAREAALAMGMMAGLRRETDPEVRATALAAIPKLLASQRTAEGLSPVFGAIANLGDPSTMALVEPYTRHADPGVRSGAARSFRRLPAAELTALLAPWLARESDAAVKRELYVTLGKNMHDSQQVAEHAVVDQAIVDLQSHPGVITRRALIKVLGVAAREYEPARLALMAQAKKETALRSGLYPLITRYLGADELLVALSNEAEAP